MTAVVLWIVGTGMALGWIVSHWIDRPVKRPWLEGDGPEITPDRIDAGSVKLPEPEVITRKENENVPF